jgi:hypothetical protein
MDDDARDHDAWFRAEIMRAMAEADDPTVELIPNDVVKASWRLQRAALVEQLRRR